MAGSLEIANNLDEICQRLCDSATDHAIHIIVDSQMGRVMGIENGLRTSLSLAKFREQLLAPWSQDGTKPRIVQVIGDSGTPFAQDKIDLAQHVIRANLQNEAVLEYGFTSWEHDANWLVEDLANRDDAIASRVIANVVQRTTGSLRLFGWSGSSCINHFVLVYNKDGASTNYGDDVWISDGTMRADAGDRVLCFDGGPQTFEQCVNALSCGIEVVAVKNLREAGERNRFSAAELLLSLRETDPEVRLDSIANYLDQFPAKAGSRRREILQVAQQLSFLPKTQISSLIIAGYPE